MQLSVIVVTHDSSRWLEGYAASWRKTIETQNLEWEVVVADAGSSDNSPTLAIQIFAKRNGTQEPVKVLTVGNIGYGAAANRAATQAQGEWLLICNPDLTFTP